MPTQNPNGQQMADLLRDAATQESAETLKRLETSLDGLSEEEAAERLEVFGPNEVAQERKHEWLHRFWTAIGLIFALSMSIAN